MRSRQGTQRTTPERRRRARLRVPPRTAKTQRFRVGQMVGSRGSARARARGSARGGRAPRERRGARRTSDPGGRLRGGRARRGAPSARRFGGDGDAHAGAQRAGRGHEELDPGETSAGRRRTRLWRRRKRAPRRRAASPRARATSLTSSTADGQLDAAALAREKRRGVAGARARADETRCRGPSRGRWAPEAFESARRVASRRKKRTPPSAARAAARRRRDRARRGAAAIPAPHARW